MFELERSWEHAVLVRKGAADCKAMRDALLELQGGQSKIICEKHKHPLVAAPRLKSSTRACTMQHCRKKSCAKCPGYKCVIGLCRKNFTTLFNDSEESVSTGKENNHTGGNPAPDVLNTMDIGVEDDSDSEDECHVEENSSTEDFLFKDADEDEDRASDMFPDEEDELWEGDAEDINDLGADQANDGYEDLEACSTPITSASRKRLHFDSSKSAAEGTSTPNHVLLNCQGNLLIRRHAKLLPTAANRHFLQKLNATYEGDGVPLIHPEATLFPAFFGSGTRFFKHRCCSLCFAAGQFHFEQSWCRFSLRPLQNPFVRSHIVFFCGSSVSITHVGQNGKFRFERCQCRNSS
jgi:hypothetical protein